MKLLFLTGSNLENISFGPVNGVLIEELQTLFANTMHKNNSMTIM